jgi:hypothetical protein
MALQLEHVGGVKVRMRDSVGAPEHGLSPGQLLAYVVSGLAGVLFGFHVTGPILARFFLG